MGKEDCLTRGDVETKVVARTGLTKKDAKQLSKLDILTIALKHGLITEAQFKESSPSLPRTRSAYLYSLLVPGMRDTVDEYVRFANALYARGSLILNMFVGDLVDDAADGTTDAIEFLTDATFLKTLVWPSERPKQSGRGVRSSELNRASECIESWLEVNGSVVDRLVDPAALRKFASARDQMLNVFQRIFFGELKTHVTCHLSERLVRLFSAVYEAEAESETKATFAAACNAVLSYRLDGLPDAWSDRVRRFRADMEIPEGMRLGSEDESTRVVREALDVESEEEDEDGETEVLESTPDDEDESSDVRRLKAMWPIHCRVSSALEDAHRQQIERGVKKRPIRTMSLLPIHAYRRRYVLIEDRIMAALIKIRNGCKSADEARITVAKGSNSLSAVLKIPPDRDLKDRRRALRRRTHRDVDPVRGSCCGRQYRWPSMDRLTSIRTDGVGVRLLFDLKGKRNVKTFDAWSEASDGIRGCRNVAGCGGDPGDVVAVQTEAVSMRDVDNSSSCPDDFWTRGEVRTPIHSIGTLLSSKTYYRRGGVDKTMRWTQARQASMPAYQEACRALAAVGSWRTTDPSTFRAMCWTLNEHASAFRAYDMDTKEVAKQRMWTIRRKRSQLDQAAQRIVRSVLDAAKEATGQRADGVVIAYGNASTRTVRGRRCVPKKDLLTALRRAVERVKTRRVKAFFLSVSEKRTTLLCHRCHHVMGTFEARHQDRPDKIQTDRNIRGCTHCGTPATPLVRSRDGNAARNILYKAWIKLSNLILPEAFSSAEKAPRPQNLGRAPKVPRRVVASAA